MKQTLSEFMGCMEWDKGELCDLIDELHADVRRRDVLLKALWTRIDFEYPRGGFPDMGVFEDELKHMGVI